MIPLILAAVGGAILGNALRSDVKKFSSGGEILLAPNGKPSNLNSEQWHLVRTPEFKAWFGDFENDPENSSKVVDKNGEPLVVYHGSSYGSITNFNRNESSRLSSGLKEYGSYFATNKKLAEFYHTHGKLKKETIDDIDFQIYRLDKAIDNVKSNRDYDDITNEIERLEKIKKGKVYPVFLKLMKIWEFDAKGKEEMKAWYELKVDAGYKIAQNRDAMDFLKNGKFGVEKVDGILAKNIIDAFIQGDEFLSKELIGNVYLVFDGNENNIKLADGSNTTFDGSNPDIRYGGGGLVSDGNRQDYLKWKRKNVTLRGVAELGEENGGMGKYGSGLYTAFLGNKEMAKEYGKVYFVLNAIPEKPKVVNDTNAAEMFIQNIINNWCKEREIAYNSNKFYDKTNVRDEMIKLGYDGLVIKGREMVNYNPPENVIYFENERQLEMYYDNKFK